MQTDVAWAQDVVTGVVSEMPLVAMAKEEGALVVPHKEAVESCSGQLVGDTAPVEASSSFCAIRTTW